MGDGDKPRTGAHLPRVRASILVYGAYGYTGELVLRRAREVGLDVVAAGRDDARTAAVARAHGFAHRVAALEDTVALDRILDGVRVVLHCAGPFARTSRPMVEACLRRGVHYLDVTGEIEVFEAVAARDTAARAAGIVLLPGAGFDVVPSDCLAAHLKARLPSATRLTLAFRTTGGLSRGTATTMAENAGKGGAIRRGGRIVRVPAAWRGRPTDFGDGRLRLAVTIPWGDVSTAWYSTGIPDIEVYTAMAPSQRRALVASRWLGWLLAGRPVRDYMVGKIRARPAGPDDARRAAGRAWLRGEAADDAGRRVVSFLQCPEGYTLTAMTALECARRVLDGAVAPGFRTPSMAFGADFILQFDGVTRTDA